jgi:Xaa-Pro aminopeptidase
MDYSARQGRITSWLAENKVDCLLLTRMTNIRYLTGFTGSAGFLLASADGFRLLVDFRYATQAAEQTSGIDIDGSSAPPQLWASLLGELAGSRLRLAFEELTLTVGQLADLRENSPAADLVPTQNLVEGMRVIKDPDEVALLRQAAQVADTVIGEIKSAVAPGMTENELAGEIERWQRRLGAERSMAPLIVASGERSALPHGVASPKVIGWDEPLMVDISPVIGGYRADLTRTFYLGKADPEFAKMYRVVREAQAIGQYAIRPGVPCREADKQARDHITRAGYGELFNHSLGHGIGLDQHEPPRLSPHDRGILAAGMVVMIEPGIYRQGLFGARLEDAVLVTEDGCELLWSSDREMCELPGTS